MRRSLLVFLAMIVSQSLHAANAPVPAPSDERSRLAWALADALGDERYAIREVAKQGLFELGRSSLEPLEFAAHSDDCEMRLRATELLIALRGRGFLGIQMMQRQDADPGAAHGEARLPFWRVWVNYCQPHMPAETAGMLNGDIILSIDGKSIQDTNALQQAVFSAGPAKVLMILVERAGERLILPVTVTLNMIGPTQFSNFPVRLPPVKLEQEPETVKGEDAAAPDPRMDFGRVPPLPAPELPQDRELVARIAARMKLAREAEKN